ncbi:MAG: endopeptidase La, partial [Candidatus Binatia bacterium]
MEKLRLVPLDELVVFPGMTVTLPVDAGHEKQVFLVPRKGSDYARVGVVADVSERARIPGGGTASLLTARERAVAGAAASDPEGVLRVEVQRRPDETPPRSRFAEIER